jgi:hypothetical protein
MSPQPISLRKKLGIAGKDTVAAALIAKGITMLDGPQKYLGAVLIVLGAALYLVQQFIE